MTLSLSQEQECCKAALKYLISYKGRNSPYYSNMHDTFIKNNTSFISFTKMIINKYNYHLNYMDVFRPFLNEKNPSSLIELYQYTWRSSNIDDLLQ